ncbi:hypothetical protein [Clostridium sp. OS1-26]|uniref:hypothetical protein n=1 Tax=Clostridium sp. OS1-26 TaxID=3070681 RepID=UPI0027E05AD6|nr:hypothetical protein [Clostridium sp. OS1-26]WML35351.1 hypothetical protein RCG18_00885 [Clostridium sp. OS1-26]
MLNKAFKQARKAIESLYDCTCNISRYDKAKDSITKETKSKLALKYKDVQCRVSKQSLSKNNQTDIVNQVAYELKLFIAPELEIHQGDEIEVTTRELKVKYIAGEPFKYSSHQEIILLNKDGKA